MLQETREAPERVAGLLRQDTAAYRALANHLAARPLAFAATVARGSSDHAASYAASLLGIACGLVTASIPSIIDRPFMTAPPRRTCHDRGSRRAGI